MNAKPSNEEKFPSCFACDKPWQDFDKLGLGFTLRQQKLCKKHYIEIEEKLKTMPDEVEDPYFYGVNPDAAPKEPPKAEKKTWIELTEREPGMEG